MWRVTDDAAAYPRWLEEIYGPAAAPKRDRWISYDDIRPKLATWSIAEFDASPLMDQWTLQRLATGRNFLGDLVEYRQHARSRDAVRLRRRADAERLRRLRLRQADAQGAVHRELQPRLLAGDHPLVQPAQRDARGHHAFSPDRSTTTSGRRGITSPTATAATSAGWRMVRRQDAEAVARRGRARVSRSRQKDRPADERRGVDARRRRDLLQPRVDPARLDPRRRGARQDVDQPQRRRPARRAAHVRHAWENMLRDAGLQYNFVSYVGRDPAAACRTNTGC